MAKRKDKAPTVCKVICFAGQKGGIGKTMCSGNIAAALSQKGKRVCLIDLDPQANLSYWFAGQKDLTPSITHFLQGEGHTYEVPDTKGNLHIIPANSLDLLTALGEYNSSPTAAFWLRRALKRLEDFDVVILDMPPNLGILTVMGLVASNYVFMPISPAFFSWESLKGIQTIVEEVREEMNPSLEIGGIILNMYEHRLKIARGIRERIEEENPKIVMKAIIRKNTQLDQSTGSGHSIFSFAPKSPGAEDFNKLAKEVERRIWNGKR